MRNYIGEYIAFEALKIKVITLHPDEPIEWASGCRMPIYNDNRMFLEYPNLRRLIINGFIETIEEESIPYDTIAGTSTAGISWAILLADKLNCPMCYIRSEPKKHGLQNQIEGIASDKDLSGKNIIVIEDLISTGGSSAKAVQAVRDAGGNVDYCLSIFTYGFDKADQAFDALNPRCNVISLLSYDVLLQAAEEIGYLTGSQVTLLEEWRKDPFGWWENQKKKKVKV